MRWTRQGVDQKYRSLADTPINLPISERSERLCMLTKARHEMESRGVPGRVSVSEYLLRCCIDQILMGFLEAY
jgi:hypothetical protein